MYYFYVLISEKDGKYYYGSSDNLRRRIKEHRESRVSSTKHRLPLRLIYYEAYESLDLARQREKQVKSSGNARKTLIKRISKMDP